MANTFDGSVLGSISSLIGEINTAATKTAAAKTAAEAGGSGSAKKDPGGIRGASTHPSAKLDGNLHAAPVGFRAKENTEDVNKDVPQTVQQAKDNAQDDSYDHVQIGMKIKPTGEDPASEDNYKGDKDDPGTDAKMNTDVGEKYGSMNFPQIYKLACHNLNDLLARLGGGETYAASDKQAQQPAAKQAAQAGYDLAAAAGDHAQTKLAHARDLVATIIQEAYEDADLAGELIHKSAAYEQQLLNKRAEGEMPPDMAAMMGGGGGGMPPGGPGGEAPDPAALAGGASPDMAPPGGGGGEMGGMPPGGPEGAGGGEMGGGGDPNSDEVINELVNALLDAGLQPDKLIAALQGAAGGGGAAGGEPAAPGGEAPPEMGGGGEGEAPPEEKAGAARLSRQELATLVKCAHEARTHLMSGNFVRNRKPAGKQAAERKEAVDYLNYVREVLAF